MTTEFGQYMNTFPDVHIAYGFIVALFFLLQRMLGCWFWSYKYFVRINLMKQFFNDFLGPSSLERLTFKEREDILKVILKDERVEENIDFDYLTSLCEGNSGSHLLELCIIGLHHQLRSS